MRKEESAARSSDIPNRLRMYRERMQEVKQRLDVVATLLGGALVYDHPTVECIYLQLRNVLELIATASLSANPGANSELERNGRRKWHAGDILEAVKAVNPAYYFPKPTRLVPDHGSDLGNMEGYRGEQRDFEGDYLTRERFTSLYDLCSATLHTPNPFDRRARPRDRRANARLLRQAEVWHRRIQNLLCHHQFFLPGDDERMYVCHVQEDGTFNIAIFQKMEDISADHSTLAEVAAARARMLAEDGKEVVPHTEAK